MTKVTFGSRGSQLALAQTRLMAERLEELHPGLETDIEVIRTTGDRLSAGSLAALAQDTKGLFVKELEEALLEGSVDLAVHSLKDVPTDLPEGLYLGAVPRREDPRDALLSRHEVRSLADLPAGAVVGTSSLRRKVQLQRWREDLEVVPLRGNVDTRIRKLHEEELDAIVLAMAGLKRLDLTEHVSVPLEIDEMIPAIGQGALALEIRENDEATKALLELLEDHATRRAVSAERAFLLALGGGCQVPMGAFAEIKGDRARFRAFLADPSTGEVIQRQIETEEENLLSEAEEVAEYFKQQGAAEILREIGI